MLIPNKFNGYSADNRRIYYLDFDGGGGGGGGGAAPDYDRLEAAISEANQIAERLGTRQLDFAERQYEEMSPFARRLSEAQAAAQEEQLAQGRDYYDYMTSTFRPLERGLVQRAQEFDTDAYREQLASQAAADAARAFGSTQEQTARGLARMGVAPGSGAAMAQMNQNALGLASMRAGAMTGSRLQSEREGLDRLYNAAALGRGLPAQSSAAYTGSVGAGTSGIATAMAPGGQYMLGLTSGAGTIMQGQQAGLQALSGMTGQQAGMYSSAQSNRGEMMGTVIGAGATLGAAFI
jgi:hypothetical protein